MFMTPLLLVAVECDDQWKCESKGSGAEMNFGDELNKEGSYLNPKGCYAAESRIIT